LPRHSPCKADCFYYGHRAFDAFAVNWNHLRPVASTTWFTQARKHCCSSIDPLKHSSVGVGMGMPLLNPESSLTTVGGSPIEFNVIPPCRSPIVARIAISTMLRNACSCPCSPRGSPSLQTETTIAADLLCINGGSQPLLLDVVLLGTKKPFDMEVRLRTPYSPP